jgi:hypothetical protein
MDHVHVPRRAGFLVVLEPRQVKTLEPKGPARAGGSTPGQRQKRTYAGAGAGAGARSTSSALLGFPAAGRELELRQSAIDKAKMLPSLSLNHAALRPSGVVITPSTVAPISPKSTCSNATPFDRKKSTN